jgi:sulfoxide reductase heme-binding subunit YedZ
MKRFLPQTLVVLAALVPAALLVSDFLRDNLGANPIEEITHRTGDWAIRLLLGALAITPLRRLTGLNPLIRFRRTLGLLAFGYASLHFLTYAILDQGLFLQEGVLGYVAEDVMKRPYITVGFTAFVLLLPLAVTSTKGWIRRLGKRWTALHRLVYVAAALAALHYLWLVKGEQVAPVWYALILVGLLALRLKSAPRRTATERPPGRATARRPAVSPPRPALPSREAARPAPTPAAAPPHPSL